MFENCTTGVTVVFERVRERQILVALELGMYLDVVNPRNWTRKSNRLFSFHFARSAAIVYGARATVKNLQFLECRIIRGT